MSVDIPAEYKTAEGLRTLANFLRSSNGVKVRSGIEHEKRVDYFKGKRLVEVILEPKKGWPKSIPKITDKGIAILVASQLLQNAFFHRSEKVDGKKGFLRISQKNVFEDGGYYTWMYAGNTFWSNIATGAVIAVVIGFTLLPIWPDAAKRVLWYCSVTFLIATLAFCLVRFLLFLSMWLLGYEFWIFPRLFDESLSFQDSFKPVYTFDKGTTGQGYYRIGVVLMLVGFVYWACTQPTEFDGFIRAQKDFLDDIYNGNLLADVAQDHRDNLDRTKRVPNLEDLLREMEEDDKVRISEAGEKPGSAGAGAWASEDFGDNEDGTGVGSGSKTGGGSEQIEELVNADGEAYSQEEIDDRLLDELLKDHDE